MIQYILFQGDLITPAPSPQPTVSPGTCAAGFDLCCSGPGVVGCGLRFNIPITPTTAPAPGQMVFGAQPWQAVILGTDNSFVGGGVLLDSLNVLTAAHKITNRYL